MKLIFLSRFSFRPNMACFELGTFRHARQGPAIFRECLSAGAARRNGVLKLLLMLLVAFLSSGAFQMGQHAQAAELRVRRSQKDIGSTEKQLLVNGIKALRAQAAKGNTAGVNNRLDEFVVLHNMSNPHAADIFLPWHRQMLLDFENEIRALPGPLGNPDKFKNFTVPYWDWTKDSFPSHLCDLCQDNLFMGPNGDTNDNNLVKGGPFAGWDTTEAINGTKKLQRRFINIEKLKTDGTATLPNLLQLQSYMDFNMCNEGHTATCVGMHNDAHGRVGGHLGNPAKGADEPTFWMLHAFADLLWAKWELGPGTLSSYEEFSHNPDDPFSTPRDTAMKGFGDALGTSLGFNQLVAPNNVLNYFALGYTYEYMGAQFVPEPSAACLIVMNFCSVSLLWPRRVLRFKKSVDA